MANIDLLNTPSDAEEQAAREYVESAIAQCAYVPGLTAHPRPVREVGVIGGGTMGGGIAMAFANAGFDVILLDNSQEALERGLARVNDNYAFSVKRGKLSGADADLRISRIRGTLRYEDLAAHEGNWVDPVSTNYRGFDVWELPPSGQGIAALQILNLLEPYDLAAYGFGSPEHVHLFVEAKKLAFADRARWYADPEFHPAPVTRLISKQYAAERGELMSIDRAARQVQPGTPAQLDEGDTIYLATADADGMMVSLIQSNYRGMGSGMAPPGLGFILQNRGEQFVLGDEDHPNAYAPGKRPFHTIIPAFVTRDGEPWLAYGVMGGAMQPQGHVQILLNMIDFGMNLQEAGDAPRIHHDGSAEPVGGNAPMADGGRIELESGFPYATVRELMRRGHRVQFADGPYGGYQAIQVNPHGGWIGASESRKDGQAAGY